MIYTYINNFSQPLLLESCSVQSWLHHKASWPFHLADVNDCMKDPCLPKAVNGLEPSYNHPNVLKMYIGPYRTKKTLRCIGPVFCTRVLKLMMLRSLKRLRSSEILTSSLPNDVLCIGNTIPEQTRKLGQVPLE